MARAEYSDTEHVDFKEPTAPISMAELMGASPITLMTVEQRREWCAASMAGWHMVDAYGQVIEEAPSAQAIMRLDYSRIKWLFQEVLKATIELPLSLASGSLSAITPAADPACSG